MPILEVQNVRKVYTTRFGAHQVEALKDVSFSDYGRVRFGKDDALKYTGGT